jgi:hypothetical protein
MIPWEKRPDEVANLLNPAFCGEIIRRCIKGYQKRTEQTFEYPLLYLILPIVLHRGTRDKINPRSKNKMHTWLQENQDVRIGYANRAKRLVPITREAVQFLICQNALEIDSGGGVIIPSYRRKNIEGHNYGEIADIFKKAEVVGKWFSNSGTTSTIYTMRGVKP